MDKQIYKHHWRHGHHHHKHKTAYALMTMIFYGLIALGVVMAINYSLKTKTNAGAEWQTFQNNEEKYSFAYPTNMRIDKNIPGEIAVGYPNSKWVFAVSSQPNNENFTLEEVFQSIVEQMSPSSASEYSANDMKTYNLTVDGKPAKGLSIKNFGDQGETVVVTLSKDRIYVLRGSTGQAWTNPENDLVNFVKTFDLK
jgi:hypothetical protein